MLFDQNAGYYNGFGVAMANQVGSYLLGGILTVCVCARLIDATVPNMPET